MADLKTNIELDDQRFQRAAKRVARETQTMGKAMERSIRVDAGRSMDELVSKFTTVDYAIQIAMRSFRAASAAVGEYRDQFPGMTENINDVDAAVQRFQRSIGRDLAVAIDGSAGFLVDFIDTANDLRLGLVDIYATAFGADVKGINEATAAMERQDDLNRQRVALVEMERRTLDQLAAVEEDRLRASGEYIKAATSAMERKIERIADEARAQKQGLKELELNSQNHAAAVELIDRQSHANRTMAQREYTRAIESEEEKRAEAARKSAEQAERAVAEATRFAGELVASAQRTERDRGAARERLEDARAQRSIEVAMLEGRRREATLAGLQLRFARERREVERDELLGVREKADALAALARDQEKITGLVMQRTREEERGRAAGVAGGTLGGRRDQAQQLGVRASERTADATASTAADAKKVVEQLGRILGVLSVPQGAVFQ